MNIFMDQELRTQRTYNNIAQRWAREHNTKEYWREEFEVFSRKVPHGKVLDVGCGPGKDYQLFQERGYDYTGVDFSTGLLAVARSQFPAAEFVEGSMYSLPFSEHEFDGFWAAASLLHIPKQKIPAALQSIKRVIRENGAGAIMLKKGEGEKMVTDDNHSGDPEDQRFFAYWQKDEFTDALHSAGFTVADFLEKPVSARTIWLSFFVTVA